MSDEIIELVDQADIIEVVEQNEVIELLTGIPGLDGNDGGGEGTSDHGLLTGLDDDDHPQYHTDARGDARYYLKTAVREKLTADRTYYVRTDGNDNNTGLVNNAGGAFQTIQGAANYFASKLDLAGFNIILRVADGTYAGAMFRGALEGRVGIKGNALNVDGVVIGNGGSGICLGSDSLCICSVDVIDVTLDMTGVYYAIAPTSRTGFFCVGFSYVDAAYGAVKIIGTPLAYSACFYAYQGAIEVYGNLTLALAGPSDHFALVNGQAAFDCYPDNLIATTPQTFAVDVLLLDQSSRSYWYVGSLSGTINGIKYKIFGNSTLGGAAYVPGTSPGILDTSSKSDQVASLAGADLASDDTFDVYDTSAGTKKTITFAELLTRLGSGGGGGGSSPSLDFSLADNSQYIPLVMEDF